MLPPAAPGWELGLLAVLALLAGGKKLRVIGLGKNVDQTGSLSLGFIIILAAILRGGPLPGCTQVEADRSASSAVGRGGRVFLDADADACARGFLGHFRGDGQWCQRRSTTRRTEGSCARARCG